MDSRELGITRSMIPVSSWIILKVLQNSGENIFCTHVCLAVEWDI